MTSQTTTKGFIIAGLMNTSVLVFSRGFTNTTINEYDPNVMSNFGLLIILIWGLAYITVAKSYQNVKWLIAVFTIEKFIYGYVWVQWMLNNNVSEVYEKDKMAGLFYSVYGINDWLFFAFFLSIFISLNKQNSKLK